MAISLPDARELSDDVLEAVRLRALRGCELGLAEAEVADLLGVCRETVSRWWSASSGPADPDGYCGNPSGLSCQAVRMGSMIAHSASISSLRVNSVASPRMASRMSRS